MASKFLDSNGLIYLWSKIKTIIPTKLTDLINDAGFITTSDIPEGAAASTTTPKMAGTAAVGSELAFARGDHVHPSDTTKVDKVDGKGLSTNDYTTTEKNKLAGIAAGAEVNVNADWNATSGDAQILNKPTAVSAFTNDAGYLTSHQSLADYYTKTQVDGLVSGVLHYKGTVATTSALPTSNQTTGDVYNVTSACVTSGSLPAVNAGDNVAWNGSGWDVLAGTVDLSSYVLATDIISNSDIDTIVAS